MTAVLAAVLSASACPAASGVEPPAWTTPLLSNAGWSEIVPGVSYRLTILQEPRIVRLHILRIDLREPTLEMAVAISEDPDGDGPAEAVLEDPIILADRAGFLAAVNANAFGPVTNIEPKKSSPPREREAVKVCGWVVDRASQRCPPEKGYASFWVTSQGQSFCGTVTDDATPAEAAVSGFGLLLRQGRVVPPPETTVEPHPRTAVGRDDGGRVYLLVADGRQKGYSEGLTNVETAHVLLAVGGVEAVSLDGGGSSVMLLRDLDGAIGPVNRPSDRTTLGAPRVRPVPVLLGGPAPPPDRPGRRSRRARRPPSLQIVDPVAMGLKQPGVVLVAAVEIGAHEDRGRFPGGGQTCRRFRNKRIDHDDSPTDDRGPTRTGTPGSVTTASPAGAPLSSTRSQTSASLRPVGWRLRTDPLYTRDVTAIVRIPFRCAARAMSIATALRPEVEATIKRSPAVAGVPFSSSSPKPGSRSIREVMVKGRTERFMPCG
jgi:hypothetical protein